MLTDQELDQKLTAMEVDLRAFLERHTGKSKEVDARLKTIEQSMVGLGGAAGGGSFGDYGKSIGQQIIESEGFQALVKGARSSGTINVKSFQPPDQKTVLTGTWSAAPQYVPVVATPGQRRLVVRDLLPQLITSSNMIEFAREDTATGGAGYQQPEGSDKPESSFTYSLQTQNVVTLAHWLGASRQLLDDSLAFSQYVNGRMLYLLQLKEETELLFGDNSTGHLKGLCPSATAFAGSGGLIDSVGAAVAQLASVDREADSVVVNVSDWWAARLQKAVTAGTYLIGSPLDALAPSLWGLRTVATPSMPSGHFLAGQFQIGAALFDRMAATIEVSREHSDFFVKNLVAILCEERLSQVIYRGDAFVYGSIGAGS